MADKIAEDNVDLGGGPFGVVIVKDGKIIASGANSVTIDNDPTAHAEVNAIRNACRKLGTFRLSGCTVYSSCEPCPMCLSALYWAGVERRMPTPSISPTPSSTANSRSRVRRGNSPAYTSKTNTTFAHSRNGRIKKIRLNID